MSDLKPLNPSSEDIAELIEVISKAEHDYRVGNTLNPHDFNDIIEAAKQYIEIYKIGVENE